MPSWPNRKANSEPRDAQDDQGTRSGHDLAHGQVRAKPAHRLVHGRSHVGRRRPRGARALPVVAGGRVPGARCRRCRGRGGCCRRCRRVRRGLLDRCRRGSLRRRLAWSGRRRARGGRLVGRCGRLRCTGPRRTSRLLFSWAGSGHGIDPPAFGLDCTFLRGSRHVRAGSRARARVTPEVQVRCRSDERGCIIRADAADSTGITGPRTRHQSKSRRPHPDRRPGVLTRPGEAAPQRPPGDQRP